MGDPLMVSIDHIRYWGFEDERGALCAAQQMQLVDGVPFWGLPDALESVGFKRREAA